MTTLPDCPSPDCPSPGGLPPGGPEPGADPFPQELAVRVAASTGLPEATARRVVADVTAYFGETVREYVRRRHEELRRQQRKNDDIWPVIEAELASRRFAAPGLSERQLRRLIYG
jgi:hypothetical protein